MKNLGDEECVDAGAVKAPWGTVNMKIMPSPTTMTVEGCAPHRDTACDCSDNRASGF